MSLIASVAFIDERHILTSDLLYVLSDEQAIELNNGRAAQMGILGLMMHEAVNNHPYIINDLVRYD